MRIETSSSNTGFAAGVRGSRGNLLAAVAILLTMGCSETGQITDLTADSARALPAETGASVTSDRYLAAAWVEILRGNHQTGSPNETLTDVLRVRVNNGYGKPMPNTPVSWNVTRGGGSFSTAQTTTDANGITEVRWKLGSPLGMQYANATSGPALAGFEATTVAASDRSWPAKVTTLAVDSTRGDRVYLRFTEVDDGRGQAANYAVRYHMTPIGWNWGSATAPATGTCRSLKGSSIGAVRRCWIGGLKEGVSYDVQMVAWRTDIYGATVYSRSLSNIATSSTLAGDKGTLSISPGSVSFGTVGSTRQLAATARDASGNILSNPGVTWTSSNNSIATVNSNGMLTARGVGTVLITAAAACCTAERITVSVQQPTVASVSVSPASASLTQGQDLRLSATVRDAGGNTLSRTVTWQSSNSTVASVSSSGNVHGASAGTVSVTAQVDGRSATTSITVRAVETEGRTVATWPNEPSDFSLNIDEPFSNRTLSVQPAGPWEWGNYADTSSDLMLVPGGDGSAMRWLFAAGRAGGDSPGRAVQNSPVRRFRSYYIGVMVRWSVPWTSHGSGVNKILYWGSPEARERDGTGPSQFILNRRGSLIDFTLQWAQGERGQTNVPWSDADRIAATRVDDGRWHRVEVRFDGNDAGLSNCRARLWVDGVLNLDVGNLVCASGTGMFYGVNLDPVWGGMGETKPQLEWMDLDHLRVSGR